MRFKIQKLNPDASIKLNVARFKLKLGAVWEDRFTKPHPGRQLKLNKTAPRPAIKIKQNRTQADK